jgi:hypothetical protein
MKCQMLRCDSNNFLKKGACPLFFIISMPICTDYIDTKGMLIIAAMNKIVSNRRVLILPITPYLIKY